MGIWAPITGIPEPPWGITQEVTDLSGLSYDYVDDGGVQTYREGTNGPYTHLLDPSHPAATNTDNPYGTEAKPRVNWGAGIRNLPPGSIVEFRGGDKVGGERFEGSGTAELPIYMRAFPGYDGDTPKMYRPWFPQGNYQIYENLHWDNSVDAIDTFAAIPVGDYDTTIDLHHICIRNCEFEGLDPDGSNGSEQMIKASRRHLGDGTITYLVFDNNYVHHCGAENVGDHDISGIFIGCGTQNIWITNNHFWMMGGDGIQLNADNNEDLDNIDSPNRVFIGRNRAHDMYENLLDLKTCYDVVVLRNLAYDIGEGVGAIGKVGRGGAPYRYGIADAAAGRHRHNVWTIFNEAYNCLCLDGAFLSFNRNTDVCATDIFYIGNLVHDCHTTQENQSSTGFGFWEQRNIAMVNNTVYNVDRPLSCFGELPLYPNSEAVATIVNNVFGEVHPLGGYQINSWFSGTESFFSRSTFRNNIYYKSAGGDLFRDYDHVGGTLWQEYTWAEYLLHRPASLTESSNADPRHTDAPNGDFSLQSNSPAIRAGVAHNYYQDFEDFWGINIEEDFAGNPLNDTPDIGAFAYQGDTQPPEAYNYVVLGSNLVLQVQQ